MDRLVKVVSIDEEFEKGRGKDKRPRKKRGTAAIGKMAFWGKTSGRWKLLGNRTYLKYPETK